MTETYILQTLPQRMMDLGHSGYSLEFRHLVLAPNEVRTLQAGTDIFYQPIPLLNFSMAPVLVRIESDFGYFDGLNPQSNEMQYEHRGTLRITNLSARISHLQLIQVRPHKAQSHVS